MAMVYKVNDTATQVLAAKQIKENIFMQLVHKNGYGVNQVEETNASTVRLFKPRKIDIDARKLGESTNGEFFNGAGSITTTVDEYDLNLLYVFDGNVDIPEVQQDMVAINLFDGATKNLGGRCATEINASTIAEQLAAVHNTIKDAGGTAWTGYGVVLTDTKGEYDAFMEASTMLDDGDPVYATADGVISKVTRSRKGLGNVVEIDHGNGYMTRYAHLSDVIAVKGRKVKRGAHIGNVGVSGSSFAPHLHYEVVRDTVVLDPVNHLFATVTPEEYMNILVMSVTTGQSMD